jgi:hypothetical protein
MGHGQYLQQWQVGGDHRQSHPDIPHPSRQTGDPDQVLRVHWRGIRKGADVGLAKLEAADAGQQSYQNEPEMPQTKDYVNHGGLSRQAIFQAVNASLKRLDTEYIDLLQIHRFDNDVPIDETMQALHDLVRSGKVRYIGASSVSGPIQAYVGAY